MSRRGVAILASAALLAAVAWLTMPDWRESDEPDAPAQAATPETLARGSYLARAGNCAGCHSLPGQPGYAGGRRIPTPFGDVFSGNLTPDVETGLGAWTPTDFWRAMHHGKSRDGRRLSPAFPYTNYTRMTRADSDAIYLYLRSLPPVRQPATAPQLRFPYNTQFALMVWRALYFRPGTLKADTAQTAAWNRGAYLVEGLGHCDACHTPRDALGGLDGSAAYAGGPIPMMGWDASPLATAVSMSDADAQAMRQLLKGGVSRVGVASGPMAEVVFNSLQYLSDEDIAAMVDYLRSLPAKAAPRQRNLLRVDEQEAKRLLALGSVVYTQQCASCHGDDGRGKPYVYPALAGNPQVTSGAADNAMQSVLHGGFGPATEANPRPYGMPPYRHQLDNERIAGVLTFIRSSWGNAAPPVSGVEVGLY